MPFFNCNNLQRASITELFQACLIVSQALGEGALVQMFYSAWWHVSTALGLLCGTSGRKDLGMVPCHSCYIYGVGDA